MRVVLADDHTLVRAGIHALMEQMEGVEVVGEADNGLEAVNLVGALRPDIVVLDIDMPRLNGFRSIERISREFPSVKVIILSMYESEEYVMRALRNGAAGYLIKDATTAELRLALEAVARGESYLSPTVSKAVIASSLRRRGAQERNIEEPTPRQREVLRLIAKGQTTKEIAFTLGVSVKTVEAHRARLMERIGIRNIPGLVRYAMRIGLVPNERHGGNEG